MREVSRLNMIAASAKMLGVDSKPDLKADDDWELSGKGLLKPQRRQPSAYEAKFRPTQNLAA